jgi:gliding motility-associated-like protein
MSRSFKAALLPFFCIMLMLGTQSSAQLRADFSADNLSGCAPLVVNFTDLSSGNPSSWKWELGNGTNSVLQHPAVIYMNAGVYTVKLVVRNASGRDSITRTQLIRVFAKPTVDFSATLTTGCVPMATQFTDLSNANGGNIVSRQWDFGDGQLSTQTNPSYTYQTGGNYNVTLQVTNSAGCSQVKSVSNFIRLTTKPNASFSIGSTANCGAPFLLAFNNQTTGAGNLSYAWNFGDGNTSTATNPSNTYQNPGTYSIRLIASNEFGCRDTFVRNNALRIENQISRLSMNTMACAGSPVAMNNTSTPTPNQVIWKFSDNTSTQGVNINKTFNEPGLYRVTMYNYFGNCVDSISREIRINPKPVVDFVGDNLSHCIAPLNVQFTQQVTNAVSYEWNLGNGQTSTMANPSVNYNTPGNFDVKLKATSQHGCVNSLTKYQYVNIQLPVATFGQNKTKGCAPLEVEFTPAVVGGDAVVSYAWNFGDGNTSSVRNPTHTFAKGTYTVSLVVVTASGCTDTITMPGAVKAGNKPNAEFSASVLISCANTPITFTDLTPVNDSVTDWAWTFGDGGTSTIKNPMRTYTDTGYLDVTLIVSQYGCADTLKKEDYIYIIPPISNFIVINNCNNRMTKKFINKSKGADNWVWNFGDGNTSTDLDPVHTYSTTGFYSVVLTVTNSITGCTQTSPPRRILANNLIPEITASKTTICRPDSIRFEVMGTDSIYYNSYTWDFGDFTTATGRVTTKTFLHNGLYNIRMVSIDRNGCKDTVFKPRMIAANGPISRFSVQDTTACLNAPVSFISQAVSDGRNPLVKWIWNFGDGTIDSTSTGNSSHTFHQNGLYTIVLKAIDSLGCTHSYTKFNHVGVQSPVARFTTQDSLSCPGSNVQMNDLSVGAGLSYAWNFGDNMTSDAKDPIHTYNQSGNYSITLLVRDQEGCIDSLKKDAFIDIQFPKAIFHVSDSIGNCPPLVVNFQDSSVRALTKVWYFGDNTQSNMGNPSHFYTTADTFYSKLVVTGPGGCMDSVSQKIVVKGPRGSFQYNDYVGCSPFNVNFSANAFGASRMTWDFNDGSVQAGTLTNIAHVYQNEGKFLPKLILADTSGCMVPLIGTDSIEVHSINTAFDITRSLWCNRGDVQFANASSSADGIQSYIWNFGDGQESSVENPLHGYESVGEYQPKLIAISSYGCRDTLTLDSPIKILRAPVANIFQSPNGCVDLNVQFRGSTDIPVGNIREWSWDFGNNNQGSIQLPSIQEYTVAGNFPVSLVIKDLNGCMDTAHTTVEAYALPNVRAGIDTFLCKGRGVSLQATGAERYIWGPAAGLNCPNCANPMANPADDMEYVVTGISNRGCRNKDTIKVSVVKPFQLQASTNMDKICAGASVQLMASGTDRYQWTPAIGVNNAGSASTLATPAITTRYKVTGQDEKKCFTDSAFVNVTVFNIPTVEAGPDRTINVGQTIDIVPQVSPDVTEARWSSTGGNFRDVFPGISIKPTKTTTFEVEVRNQGGCSATDKLTVNVLCDGSNLFIPNTFSPNNDGMNDIFYPRGTGLFSISKFRIYNRWGELVFEQRGFKANDASKGWNGTFKGKKLSPDVFVYSVEVLCENNTAMTFTGNIALIK